MTAPADAPPTLDCPAIIAAGMAAAGLRGTLSLAAPITYTPLGDWVCPHGTHYYAAVTCLSCGHTYPGHYPTCEFETAT